jgi:outer membrane protein assembly factor BamA
VYKIVLSIFFSLSFYVVFAQEDSLNHKNEIQQPDSMNHKIGFRQEDISDWLLQKRITKKKKAPKQSYLLIIPFIASNPAAGVIFGGGLNYAFKANKQDTRVSAISSNASYSTKGLLNLNVKSNLFIDHERLFLNGDWRYMINNETTYGLGSAKTSSEMTGIGGIPTSTDSLGQQLKYNQVRFHETVSREVFKNFYAGIGFHYDYFYGIKDGSLDAGDTVNSHHYQYSIEHGFNYQKYTVSGLSLNLLYDSRDNQVNAYKGYFANVNFRVNSTGLGSSENSTILLTEFRAFYSLGKSLNKQVLAFWLYGNFVTSGNMPYLLLPAVGYDQRQRTGRGYTFGRFRGENMIYGETEYRFPISRHTGILGGVLFLNATTTSDKETSLGLFEYIRPAGGVGLRIMMDKVTRTRLEVDGARANKTTSFYLGAQETY